jgi:hypothetical protein
LSSHFVCPVCGKPFECGPHPGPQNVISTIQECPLKKGAIYVFVRDDLGRHIAGVKTLCSARPESKPNTDPEGFAFFEQLDENTYTTSIDLGESVDNVRDNHYAVFRTSIETPVQKGKITLVEFVLHLYADMLAKLVRTDGKSEPLPRANFGVGGDSHTPDPASKDHQQGQAPFPKLKPTANYTVVCKLLSEDDAKNFKLAVDQQADQRVKAGQTTEVIFKVEPRFWIDLALIDKKDDTLKGNFALKPKAGNNIAAQDVDANMRHIPDLQPDTIDIEELTLTDSREFVDLT